MEIKMFQRGEEHIGHVNYEIMINGVFVGHFIVRQSKLTYHINWAEGFKDILGTIEGDASMGIDYAKNELENQFKILELLFLKKISEPIKDNAIINFK